MIANRHSEDGRVRAPFARRIMLSVCMVLLMIGGIAVGVATAQDDTTINPVATLEAGDFRALGVMENGNRLLVADASSSQVRVYDISTPDTPILITAVDLSGTPVAIAGAQDYAIVAVQTGGAMDALEVIAPSSYNRRRPYLALTYIDVPAGVRDVSISPDGRWGVAVSASGYTLLEILAPDEINSTIVEDGRALNDAAVSADRLFLAVDGGMVETAILSEGAAAEPETALDLGAPAVELAVNATGSVVAALTINGQIMLIDAGDLELMSRSDADGGSELHFLDGTSADALMLDGTRRRIQLFDIMSSGAALSLTARGALELSNVARQLTTFDNLIFVTDGTTVEIFGVR
ncbi:MAG: hypothetical protein SGI73_13955, partial [Chloroflexota bacterium]|nr:hypothetical protein [Chloroflexota bacterium]